MEVKHTISHKVSTQYYMSVDGEEFNSVTDIMP